MNMPSFAKCRLGGLGGFVMNMPSFGISLVFAGLCFLETHMVTLPQH